MELNVHEAFRARIILIYVMQMLNAYRQVDVNANLVILATDKIVQKVNQ